MLTRADVERIIKNALADVSVHVHDGDFLNPNSRKIELSYRGEVFSTSSFDVVQKSEYEG